MDTKLIAACDGVWKAMFRAEFNKDEIEVLKMLKHLIDSTLDICKRREESEDE